MAYDTSTVVLIMFMGFTLAAPLGPVNVEMLKRTLSSKTGWKLGTITGVGAMSGDFVIAMTVLFVGGVLLSALLDIMIIKLILFLVNAFILGFIGISALRSKVEEDNLELNNTDNHSLPKQFMYGLLIVMTSPWSYLWWVSFGPVILESGIPLLTMIDRLQVTVIFLAGIFAWVVLFNGALKVSHSFASPRVLTWITKGSAMLIILFAIKILGDALCIYIDLGYCS
jgi:threonine/homoserine/homoserine lactone efflux protein